MERIAPQAPVPEAPPAPAEEKRRLLSRLLARLAHEIRNPLSSLDIHVQLLEEDLAQTSPETKAKLSGRLEIIRGELHRLENIVRQFLRLAGPSALDLAPVKIGEVIGHICDLLQPEAAARRIALEAKIAEGLPPIAADHDQLIQALLNLVINALQAVERDGRVQLEAWLADGTLAIAIRDTGPGIPADRLQAIFEPYFTTKPEGSGIGLWIAQEIVLAHGGSIQAANSPEGGAVFTMRLPLERKAVSHG